MQNRRKESTGVAFLERRTLFRSPAEQESASPGPAFQATDYVAIGGDQAIVATGRFASATDFGSGTPVANLGGDDAFLLALDR